jgi:ribonuclease M5
MALNENEIETKENGSNPDRRYLYVCEGVTDEDKLKKIGCLFVMKTGGKFIRPEILAFLKNVHQVREIVLVLDPDGPGKEIEARVEKAVGGCLSVHAVKLLAIRHNKVGIAQMDIPDLKELMKPFVRHDLFVDENPSVDDEEFYELGLEGAGSKEKKAKLIRKYSIPYTSSKNVEDALLMLGKTPKDIKEDLLDD